MAPQKQQRSGGRSSTRAPINELTQTGQQMNSIGIEFLKIDVQTALTFAGLALDTEDQEKKDRNRGNARKAYETILCLWKTVHFTPAEEAYMKKMMGRLKNELGELGETF